jgi:hypothetical protein
MALVLPSAIGQALVEVMALLRNSRVMDPARALRVALEISKASRFMGILLVLLAILICETTISSHGTRIKVLFLKGTSATILVLLMLAMAGVHMVLHHTC